MPPPSLCPGKSGDMQEKVTPAQFGGGFTPARVCFWWLVALQGWVGQGRFWGA